MFTTFQSFLFSVNFIFKSTSCVSGHVLANSGELDSYRYDVISRSYQRVALQDQETRRQGDFKMTFTEVTGAEKLFFSSTCQFQGSCRKSYMLRRL